MCRTSDTLKGKIMPTNKAVLIPFDDTKPVEVVEVEQNDLDRLYDLVAPDTRLITGMRMSDAYLFGDDEGLLRNDAGDRINARVMQLFADDNKMGLHDFHSPLVGDWLVVGPSDDDGNNTDVPQRVIDFAYSWTAKRPES
jgi:hypothetical protein